ncbi:MAG: CDP-glucose 4,6-dehydratase [Marinilabiliales bacterium]|nr:MAG: CDP-glucose 4,6-dehydratase [Marinilabiliales bacterium]
MENLVDFKELFGGVYKNKNVLITGHTGFKGSWLALWLNKMGANVFGFALKNEDSPNHIDLLNIPIKQKYGDIRVLGELQNYLKEIQPDIVFHLAAQALVKKSYLDPIETYSTNVMGTLNVFEACKKTPSVKAIVNVTSDKCYENQEWHWGYRENEPMGGFDPYSASKACSEILTSSYRNSYFNIDNYKSTHEVLVASGRAGNVIGGGDWAADRLIPDIVKATSRNEVVKIRNPKATRPWQHVLEPLSGYLTLGWKLLNQNKDYAEAWNFGPDMQSNLPVNEIAELSKKQWNDIQIEFSKDPNDQHEAHLLMLECSKANKLLKWKPVWGIDRTLEKTIGWYRDYYNSGKVETEKDIADYVKDAFKSNISWATH